MICREACAAKATLGACHAVTVDGQTYLLASPESVMVAYTLDEVRLAQKEALRKVALAKLTDAEREALDLPQR